MNTVFKIATLAVAMTFGTVAQATSVLIDSFSDGNLANTSSPITSTTLTGSTSNIIGGQRTVTQTSVGSTNGLNLSINSGVAPGVLAHSQASGETGMTTVLWDGGGSLGGVDLTDSGTNDSLRFVIARTDANLPGNGISVQLNGGITLSHYFTAADFTAYFNSGSTTATRFLNVDFLLSGFTGATSVNSILLTIDGTVTDDWDMRIDNVGAINTQVPEPATLLLFGTGLVGVAARARRKSA